MTLVLKAFANLDDVHLVWDPSEKIKDCWGFAIECRRNGGPPKPLSNRVGFSGAKENVNLSSHEAPFQRYDWTDHAADLGDNIAYRVIAKIHAGGALTDGPASAWTDPIQLSADCGDGWSAYFNRGFVLSQFMARYMRDNGLTLADLKEHIEDLSSKGREFLSGELRKQMLKLIAETKKKRTGLLRAALYELDDEELIEALSGLSERAEIVLANGSVKKNGEDQNKDARKALRKAGVTVFNRMVSPKALGHNKFVVTGTGSGDSFRPRKVWTGSTNWTLTGLCTQLNNGVLIDDEKTARVFAAQWEALRKARNAFPTTLLTGNGQAAANLKFGAASLDVWFTRASGGSDIDELTKLVDAAKHGVLFVMFKPGAEPVLSLLKQLRKGGKYIRGVATSFTGKGKEEVDLLADQSIELALDAVETTGVAQTMGHWIREGTRGEFTNQIGWAITHSKVLCIDPFGDDPVVVTGSHNFSKSASEKNDENFVVIKGHKALAQAYAVNCMQTYNHYRWRAYLQQVKAQGKKPWAKLQKSDLWQKRLDSPNTKEMLEFWL